MWLDDGRHRIRETRCVVAAAACRSPWDDAQRLACPAHLHHRCACTQHVWGSKCGLMCASNIVKPAQHNPKQPASSTHMGHIV